MHLRLVVQDELALVDGPTQLAGQDQPVGAVAVVAGVVERLASLLALGGIHGDVGSLQQLVGGLRVVGVHGDAQAGTHLE